MARTFTINPAQRSKCPLLLGLVGPSGSGKTYSALRLGKGIQSVTGGEMVYIDTEARRALHYADQFEFQHMEFTAPFSPLDYKTAIQAAIDSGAKVIIVDSMTHEHSGEGGLLDQAEQFLQDKCGDDWNKRDKMKMLSWAKPKKQRKDLNNFIIQQGGDVAFIFCYRAHEKMKMKPGQKPVEMGYQPETTSPLMYEMVQQFLLRPCCNGIPELRPTIPEEKQIVKSPAQFLDWFKDGEQLSEEIGARFARWSIGDDGEGQTKKQANNRPSQESRDWLAEIEAAESMDNLKAVFAAAWKVNTNKAYRDTLNAAKDRRKAALEAPQADPLENLQGVALWRGLLERYQIAPDKAATILAQFGSIDCKPENMDFDKLRAACAHVVDEYTMPE